MKTIEEGAKEYSISSYPNALDMQFACEMHFEAGAEWMRKELTRWHDPKEPPQDQKHKLIKLDDCGYTLFTTGQWCPDSKRWWGAEIDENSKVIGWQEIHG